MVSMVMVMQKRRCDLGASNSGYLGIGMVVMMFTMAAIMVSMVMLMQ